MKTRHAFLLFSLVTAATLAQGGLADPARPAPDGAPRAAVFTGRGQLILPADYRDWPYLTSGMDMSYSHFGGGMDHHMFDNVFVDPRALKVFRQTGVWPEGTVLVKEGRMAQSHGSINRSGLFQEGGVMGLEAHVKDSGRFEGGWGFFDFSDGTPASMIGKDANCYSCHEAAGALDSTFVQFYPTLLPIAREKHTLQKDPA